MNFVLLRILRVFVICEGRVIDYVPVRPLIIAIDGPSGAGKGTVARAVAARAGLPPRRQRRDVPRGRLEGAATAGIPLDDEQAVADRWPRAVASSTVIADAGRRSMGPM